MMWSGVGCNPADDDTNKSKSRKEMERERGGGPTNWSQISKEFPLLLVIMSHREWNGGEDGMGEKDGGSQTSVTGTSTSKPASMFLKLSTMTWSLLPTPPLRAATVAICTPLPSSPKIIGGQASLSMSRNISLAAQSVKHTRCSPILWSWPSPPSHSKNLTLSKTSLWTSLPTFPPLPVPTLSWSWLTVALVRG